MCENVLNITATVYCSHDLLISTFYVDSFQLYCSILESHGWDLEAALQFLLGHCSIVANDA